jgi:chitin disaccharide deacetylase
MPMSSESDRVPRRRLIINADGFGMAPGVNRGIRTAVADGVVSSMSCVVNFADIEELPAFVARWPHVSVGVHFNLSVGRPLSDLARVRTLVDADGNFWGARLPRRLLSREVSREHVYRELRAQAQRMLDLGTIPSHWDGHQNKHLYPPFFQQALAVASECGIRCMRTPLRYLVPAGLDGSWRPAALARYYARHPRRVVTHAYGHVLSRMARRRGMQMADRLISPAYVGGTEKWVLDTWLQIIDTLPAGTSEIYCHPGFVDNTLRERAAYVDERELEIAVLTAAELKAKLESSRVELTSFGEL